MSTMCSIPDGFGGVGIGVRASIYTQTILYFVVALWALWNGRVTQRDLNCAKGQLAISLFFPLAILISSLVQASTLGLTSYDAVIVLSLSWISSASVFIYILLYVHHKSGLPTGQGRVDSTWKAWVRHARQRCSSKGSTSTSGDTESVAPQPDGTSVGPTTRRSTGALIKRFPLVLGSLHLTLMAALGIWLWTNLASFGSGGGRGSTDLLGANECIYFIIISILGQVVPFGSPGLRVVSLVLYALIVVPGLNLILLMIPFLGAYIGSWRWTHSRERSEVERKDVMEKPPMQTSVQSTPTRRCEAIPAFLGLGLLLAIVLVFIADIELTLSANRGLQSGDGSRWDFAQILAVLFLVFPLSNFVDGVLERRIRETEG
ncbi:hypothetical protein BKA70DRAFT_669220 [Coprinopsis sp. MPI-PUGE-AT-0042]|nr:hypothetical protein BKA70DRAFT_669220 [Coprinopsis sp. MPI-PUGE-AT-0042]